MLESMIIDRTDADMATMFSQAALGLSDGQVNTVSFCFWLVYMAETDLNDVIQESWVNAISGLSPEITEAAITALNEGVRGEKILTPDNLEYFSEKIKLYECLFGDDSRTKLFWKLNTLRNNLSHNRINELMYNDRSLADLDVKKELAIDYFRTSFEEKDWTQSKLYKSLSEEDRVIVSSQFV